MTLRMLRLSLACAVLASFAPTGPAAARPADEAISTLLGEGCFPDRRSSDAPILPALRPCGIRVNPDGSTTVVAVPGGIASTQEPADEVGGWTRAVRPSPDRRSNAAMAYLPALQGVVMFGGLRCPGWVCNPTDETWLWNGSTWSRLQPATSPPPLHAAAMTHDPARNELVLFGGQTCTPSGCSLSSETWTFDGTTWEKQTVALAPIASSASAMAFDPKSSRVILSGGCAQDRCPGLVGTWSWDGSAWALEDLLTPLPRSGASMATNPGGGVVLFGGIDATGNTSAETWTWDGEWSLARPATSPTSRAYGSATYHTARNEVVLLGGSTSTCTPSCTGGYMKDTWTWNGQTWTQRSTDEVRVGQSHTIAYDTARENIIRFGGISSFNNHAGAAVAGYESSTWVWAGNGWTERRSPMPEERILAAMGFHRDAGVLVVAGGYCAYAVTCDTWAWDGSRWSNIGVPAPRPNSRDSLIPSRDGSLLLPTSQGVWSLDHDPEKDIWSWSKLHDAPAPSPGGFATAGDRNGDVVMFGAQHCCPSEYWDRTWTWGGPGWTEEFPTARPPGRAFATMVLDEDSGDTILHGGLMAGGQTYLSDTWRWDGSGWSAVTATGPGTRAFTRVASDPATGDVMVYAGLRGGLGGGTPAVVLRDQWMFDGDSWEEVATPAPGPRLEHSLAGYPAGDSTILFGGQDANPGRPMSETWIWGG